MANDINRVVLVGRVTRDPELKSTNSGAYLCRFTLASNHTQFVKDGENIDHVGFYDCVSWGKLAEVISKYVQKGRRIGVDGSLRWSRWEDQEGNKRSKVEIYVENFQFLESKVDAEQGVESAPEPLPETQAEPFGDDIPF